MRWICSLLLVLSAIPAHAEEARAVLLLDDSAFTVSGARARVGFERFPAGGESAEWLDPTGRMDSVGVMLLAGGGLVGAGLSQAHAQSQRDDSIGPLRTAMGQGQRLRQAFEDALRVSSSANGYPIGQTLVGPSLAQGHVGRAVAPEGFAVMAARDSGRPIVELSWDDRQPLLSLDVRRYQRSGGARLLVREKAARTLRYVGYPAPSTVGAVEYWAADGGMRFIAETQAGLAAMLPLAWSADLEVPSVPRKERVALQVGEQELEFPGRLWKQDGALAYLFNSDEGITVVRTQPLDHATAPDPAPRSENDGASQD